MHPNPHIAQALILEQRHQESANYSYLQKITGLLIARFVQSSFARKYI